MSSESQDNKNIHNLNCNETSHEILLQKHANINCLNFLCSNSNSLPYEEISLVNAFDSEVDQVLDSGLTRLVNNDPWLVSARLEAVHWILKVHSYYQFKPETAYLSVKYLDKFMLSTTFPIERRWTIQLLSVACLSLAAKMEEVNVPILLDLQMKENGQRLLFKPKTVQRMELLVMAIFQWRLRIITPFDFLHYFVAKLSCFGLIKLENYNSVVSQISNIILLTCQVIDFLGYPPSTITAAATLSVIEQSIDYDQILKIFHPKVNGERVMKCYNLMKQSLCLLSCTEIPEIIKRFPKIIVLDGVISESGSETEISVAKI